ncbi:MAG: hypothetical protein JHC52_11115 [Chthoniobacterales bacterium]|nr:hypothetical protein [Chthoniobacterales bacterium]
MKHLLLHNWKIKLVCIVLGFVVWYLIQQNVDPAGEARARAAVASEQKKK